MINKKLIQFNTKTFDSLKQTYHDLQLGFFNDNLVLFVGQNPGAPFDQQSTTIEKNILAEKNFNEYEKTYEQMIKQCRIGSVITKIIKNKWHQISLTNIVKIPTANNMQPSQELVNIFIPILQKQIQLLQPQLVVLLGKFTGQQFGISSFYQCRHINNIYYTMFPHPSYLLRNGTVDEDTQRMNQFINSLLTDVINK